MPQSERAQIMKQILKWLIARERAKRPPTLLEAKRYIELEITELGAAPRTVISYLKRLDAHGLIQIRRHIICTQTGKNWLENKVS
ncbi:hypothetical protein KAR91_58580 [Candidatus Pacearchaeota archaeon]|nr:hypothetical protein [Candidatus Pacearchaeota archaeon]